MSDFFVGLITTIVYVAVICTWIFALVDLFLRHDLKGWQRAAWLFAIIFLPLLGVLAYFVTRPADIAWMRNQEQPMAPRDQQIGEIETLIRLRNQGTITADEYETMKQRVMAGV